MDLNKFTQKSQEAISEAQNIAIRFGHQECFGYSGKRACRNAFGKGWV